MSGGHGHDAGWDVDALLDDRGTEVVVCCGSGGVGKTTTAAALALRAAERGRRVAVLTVDPARRLAQALGTDNTDNTDNTGEAGTHDGVPADEPRRVAGVDGSAGGSLDALVLDAARTLDALVDAALPPQRAAVVKANPVYTALATSFSGTQEYMAMERLGQLRSAGGGAGGTGSGWDLVVVDTPPSRSALDFLEAPSRLASFLDGRFARVLTAPARLAAGKTSGKSDGKSGGKAGGLGGRVVGALAGGAAAAMDRVLGGRLLRDVQALVAGMDEVFGGFRARADATTAALSDARTAFVVVTAPELEPLTEAAYLVERLRGSKLRPAAVVVNRATRAAAGLDLERARQLAETVRGADGSGGADGVAGERERAAAVLDLQVELLERMAREDALLAKVLAGVLGDVSLEAGLDGGAALAVVPTLDGDVADLEGLRAVGAALAAG